MAKSGCNYFILRTSWLYSEFGNNFLKTMLRLAETKTSLDIVGDQIGTPTYAVDLAKVIVSLIENKETGKELFHFSNEGVASWYDFAHEIFAISNIDININSISTAEFPTLAKRPAYSVLSKSKLKNSFNYNIPHWRDSLTECITSLNKEK
ncbi:MAG: sugar nucleotide-binding protein [Bacilli bacterium]|nr:sugar nucleotide-binding protein [Bacilli bacterium]